MVEDCLIKEKRKYEKAWGMPVYRLTSPGVQSFPLFADHFQPKEGETLIDLGCGTGRCGILGLKYGLDVTLFDITHHALDRQVASLLVLNQLHFVEGTLWDLSPNLEPFDWIYCCDVLEHLPTHKIDAALSRMAERTRKGGMLQIYLVEEPFGDFVDEVFHLTIKPLDWWLEQINKYWPIQKVDEVIEGIRFCCFVGSGYDCPKQ